LLLPAALNADSSVIAGDGHRLIHLELIIVRHADGCWGRAMCPSVWCIMHLSRTSDGVHWNVLPCCMTPCRLLQCQAKNLLVTGSSSQYCIAYVSRGIYSSWCRRANLETAMHFLISILILYLLCVFTLVIKMKTGSSADLPLSAITF